MLGLLGGFIGKLFGSDKAAEALVNNVSHGLNTIVYTDQEKAEDHARDVSEARTMIIEWLKNTQGQNLARRLLAIMIASVWLLQYLVSMLLNMLVPWVNDVGVVTASKIQQSAIVISENVDQMDGAMMLLLSFYFAAPYMGKVVDAAMGKFGKRGK